MKERTEKTVYVFYTCPRCLKPSLRQVSSNLYQCLLCCSPEVDADQPVERDKVSVVVFWFVGVLLLLLLLSA